MNDYWDHCNKGWARPHTIGWFKQVCEWQMLPWKENITELAQLHQVTCIKKVTVALKRNSQKVCKPKQKRLVTNPDKCQFSFRCLLWNPVSDSENIYNKTLYYFIIPWIESHKIHLWAKKIKFGVLVAALYSQGTIAAGSIQDTSLFFFFPNPPTLFFYVKGTLKFKLYSSKMSLV